MSVSVLSIGVHRVMAAETVVAKLGMADGTPSVFPIQIPKGASVPAITVNRMFERKEDGQTEAVLAITVLAKSVQEIETIGAAMIDEMDGTENFDFSGLVGVTFDKVGPDVTGHDQSRGLFTRTLEWLVTY